MKSKVDKKTNKPYFDFELMESEGNLQRGGRKINWLMAGEKKQL